MSSTRFNQSTTPEQFIAVHDRGPHDADVRERKRVNGRVLGLVLGTVGKRVPAKESTETGTAIETRHPGTGSAGARTPSMTEMC
jgi:hypothetical protein